MGNDFQKFALQHQDDDFNKKDLMEEVVATNDTIYPCAKPSDITGQSLAVTMETDKNKVLNSMATNITPMMESRKLKKQLMKYKNFWISLLMKTWTKMLLATLQMSSSLKDSAPIWKQ